MMISPMNSADLVEYLGSVSKPHMHRPCKRLILKKKNSVTTIFQAIDSLDHEAGNNKTDGGRMILHELDTDPLCSTRESKPLCNVPLMYPLLYTYRCRNQLQNTGIDQDMCIYAPSEVQVFILWYERLLLKYIWVQRPN